MSFAIVLLWLKSRAASLFGWAANNPAWALAALFCVSTLWFWHEDSVKGKQLAQFKSAQKAEVVLQKKDVAQTEATVDKVNGVIDDGYQKGLAVGRSELAAYIAAHGVRAATSTTSSAPATTQDHGAEVPATTSPAAPTVAFTEAQLSVWDQTYQDDQSCRTWANAIVTLFDGKHWPTPDEVTQATSQNNTDIAKP